MAACLALGSGILVLGGTAIAASPSTPVITEPATDGQLVHPADVHMEAGGFSDTDGDTLQCTDWEIVDSATSQVAWHADCKTGLLAVHIHLADGTFVNAYAGHTRLDFDKDYVLRVRFKDSANELSAYATRSFRTYPPSSPGGSIEWTPLQPDYVVEKVAGGFQLPVNIAFVPNPGLGPHDPLYYVTELYGKIKVVDRSGQVSDYATGLLNFNPTGGFPGSGEQGLTGIVVDPASGDVFANLLYSTDPTNDDAPHYPKVIRLHSTDGGRTAAGLPTTVLDMPGEAQGQSHQISNLSIGPDGKLYVHMGDGFDTARAQDLTSFRGKILRMNFNGTAPTDNPLYDANDGITAKDFVYAYGFRNPFGGAWRASNGKHYEVENGPNVDRLARIDPGVNYLWDGTNASMANFALYNWDPSHAPVNIAFVQPETFGGSGFPASQQDHAFVTESGPTYATGPQTFGKQIVEFDPDPAAGGELGGHPHGLVEYTGTGQGTAVGLAAGPDGLYFSDLYKDDGTAGSDPGANVWRVRYAPPSPLPTAVSGGAAVQAPAPFDLKSAVRRCKRKFKGDELKKKRKRCIRKARQAAKG
jgi:glucose/arabinose dehydrogenase